MATDTAIEPLRTFVERVERRFEGSPPDVKAAVAAGLEAGDLDLDLGDDGKRAVGVELAELVNTDPITRVVIRHLAELCKLDPAREELAPLCEEAIKTWERPVLATLAEALGLEAAAPKAAIIDRLLDSIIEGPRTEDAGWSGSASMDYYYTIGEYEDGTYYPQLKGEDIEINEAPLGLKLAVRRYSKGAFLMVDYENPDSTRTKILITLDDEHLAKLARGRVDVAPRD